MAAVLISNGMKKSNNMTLKQLFLSAAMYVLPSTLIMILLSWLNVFTNATVELGLNHYAENSLSFFPKFVPMPFNTIINFGYVLVGIYWILFISEGHKSGIVSCNDVFMFFMFNLMGVFYGFIQLYRILFQTRASAVLDQWYTLPFFMFVFAWSRTFSSKLNKDINKLKYYILLSTLSYSLTFLSIIGFEITLGIHIVLAVGGAILLQKQYPSEEATKYFIFGILSCSGFVVLKLLDHILPSFHWIFSYVSGHFISKICDVLQLHFVNEFFFDMVLSKAVGMSQDTQTHFKQS